MSTRIDLDESERFRSDRFAATRRIAVFGAFTAPALLALLHADKAIAASALGDGDGGGGTDSGGPSGT